MAELIGTEIDGIESLRMELSELGRSLRSSFRGDTSSFRRSSTISSSKDGVNNENVLEWAAIDRLPTSERLRSALFDKESDENGGDSKGKKVVDITKLGAHERHLFVEKLIKHVENDNLKLLRKIRDRIDL